MLVYEEEADEEEHMSISPLQARRERVEPVESTVPLAMVDPKGKAVEVHTSKLHKKRRKCKTPIEEMPKKAKLLASAMSVARTTKVHLTLCLSM